MIKNKNIFGEIDYVDDDLYDILVNDLDKKIDCYMFIKGELYFNMKIISEELWDELNNEIRSEFINIKYQ